jgi:hypothetical protein
VDTVSDLYRDIRWVPEYSVAEAREARAAGRTFLHPFKKVDDLGAVGLV